MRTIRVTGQGQATAPADRVGLRLEVVGHEMEYEDAIEELNRRVAALRKDVKAAGAPAEEIKTTSFSVDVDSHWDSKTEKSVFNGYRARHRLTLEFDWDQDLLNEVLRKIATGGSCTDINLSFSVSDREGLQRAALADAVHSARQQAEVLADAAGVRLGALQSIEHAWGEVRFSRSQIAYSPMEAQGAPLADVEPEDIDTSDTATLVWEIKAKTVRKR